MNISIFAHKTTCSFLLLMMSGGFMWGMENTDEGFSGFSSDQLSAYIVDLPEQSTVIEWAQSNKTLLHALVPVNEQAVFERGLLKQALQDGNDTLSRAGLLNLSKNNYVFVLPENPELLVKIAGPINRAINILHGNSNAQGVEYGWELDKLTNDLKQIDTYQTVSIFAGYKLIKNISDKKGVQHFVVPETFLLHIPGRVGFADKIADENSFVVQRAFDKGYVPLKDNLAALSGVSNAAIQDLFVMAKEAPLWDFGAKGLINHETHKFGYTDLEQPNNMRPRQFFCVDQQRREYDALCGVKSVIQILLDASDKGHGVASTLNQFRLEH